MKQITQNLWIIPVKVFFACNLAHAMIKLEPAVRKRQLHDSIGNSFLHVWPIEGYCCSKVAVAAVLKIKLFICKTTQNKGINGNAHTDCTGNNSFTGRNKTHWPGNQNFKKSCLYFLPSNLVLNLKFSFLNQTLVSTNNACQVTCLVTNSVGMATCSPLDFRFMILYIPLLDREIQILCPAA